MSLVIVSMYVNVYICVYFYISICVFVSISVSIMNIHVWIKYMPLKESILLSPSNRTNLLVQSTRRENEHNREVLKR